MEFLITFVIILFLMQGVTIALLVKHMINSVRTTDLLRVELQEALGENQLLILQLARRGGFDNGLQEV